MHRSPTRFRARAAGLALLSALALVLAMPAPALAADKPAPLTADAAGVKKAIEQKFPGAEVRGVVKTPYFGLYEVQFDDRIVYTDAKAKYIVVGAVYDTETKTNLTEERQRKLNRVDVAALPFDMAIKKVKGTGERTLVVFSDADCPFCHKLEEELKNVDNVTIYTFLYPIDSLHPDAARKSRMIWCAPDRAKAWTDYMMSNKAPEAGKCDTTGLDKSMALARKLNIRGTPAIFLADGTRIPGYMPAAKLEEAMAKAASH